MRNYKCLRTHDQFASHRGQADRNCCGPSFLSIRGRCPESLRTPGAPQEAFQALTYGGLMHPGLGAIKAFSCCFQGKVSTLKNAFNKKRKLYTTFKGIHYLIWNTALSMAFLSFWEPYLCWDPCLSYLWPLRAALQSSRSCMGVNASRWSTCRPSLWVSYLPLW